MRKDTLLFFLPTFGLFLFFVGTQKNGATMLFFRPRSSNGFVLIGLFSLSFSSVVIFCIYGRIARARLRQRGLLFFFSFWAKREIDGDLWCVERYLDRSVLVRPDI